MPYSNIDKPSKYFNTVTYTGDGASPKSITGVGFKPDFVWSKSRSTAENHNLYDAVRGGTQGLRSNLTNAETSSNIYGYVSTFNTDGVTYISGGTNNDLNNGSGVTFVNWNWLGANTTVSNTSGSITSTVSANTTSGFSVVSWTGAGSAGTVGHGLGAVPKFIITKKRNNTGNWACYHSSLGNTQYVYLNSTNASATYSGFWNNTTPTSTLISLGTDDNVTGNGDNIIAYCFAEVKGFSKAFSYTGNGSTDGTFVYLGFRPAWIIYKITNGADHWIIFDNKRNTYNVVTNYLLANLSNAEGSATSVDFLSNGFKLKTSASGNNGSGQTFIGMAFAENPFVSSKGIPACAV
jgi:hypothetical protein